MNTLQETGQPGKKRRKTNPTGTRTATGQARTLNKRPKSKRKRPVREKKNIITTGMK